MLLLTVSICDSAVGCVTTAEWLFLTSIHLFSVNCWRVLSHIDRRTRSGQVTNPFKGISRDNLNGMREKTVGPGEKRTRENSDFLKFLAEWTQFVAHLSPLYVPPPCEEWNYTQTSQRIIQQQLNELFYSSDNGRLMNLLPLFVWKRLRMDCREDGYIFMLPSGEIVITLRILSHISSI